MASWWGDNDILTNNDDLDDIELFRSPRITIGVPCNSPPQLIKNVMAGASAYSLRLKSIDYTLKHYIDRQDINKIRNPNGELISQVTSSVKESIIDALDYLMSIRKPDIPSLFAAGAALVRLQNTFKGAALTLRTGLHFETIAMERMIIEQLAWIYRIHDFEGDFFKIEPSSCITPFKTLIPNVGNLYGYLSKKLHISPKDTTEYIVFKDNTLHLSLSDFTQIKKDAYLLLILVDMYCIVGEYIYSDLISKYKYLKKGKNNQLLPSKGRPSKKIVKRFEKQLFEK